MSTNASATVSTNPRDFVIATLGSHTALQILKGARDEGMRNLVICKKGAELPYRSYGVADEILTIDEWNAWDGKLEAELRKRSAIIIPHGSFIAYVGHERVKRMDVMYYGSKEILEWESDRGKEREWLQAAGLKLPEVFAKPQDIDRPVIVKFHGAPGGFGYFIAKTPEQFREVKERKHPQEEDYVIQEYIVGVPLYAHYFYSPLNHSRSPGSEQAITGELEIMSFDKRYESNADSIGRIKAEDQLIANIHTSYTIVGNIPVVVRESLLPEFFAMGERVVAESRKLKLGPSTRPAAQGSLRVNKGLFGPFCLECIVTRKLQIYVFEISARIVAGTNLFVEGSPYTALKYDMPMSTGRRIALDIKQAIEQGKLKEVLG